MTEDQGKKLVEDLTSATRPLINDAAVRKLLKLYGRRVSKEALDVIHRHVVWSVLELALLKNGGKVTVDAELAHFVFGSKQAELWK